MLRSSGLSLLSLACLVAVSSCGSNSGSSSVDGSGTNGAAAAANATGGPDLIVGAAGGAGGSTNAGTAGSAADGQVCGTTCPAGQPACSLETCDGIDNNCDGIIDNVDKNQDGICDCILIATLGVKGTWGQGDVFAAWLDTRSNNGATALADQTLTPELLAKYEVIVAEDVHRNHPYSPAEVQALQAWVANGGGFMTLIGYATPGEAANVNRLLQPFGMSYGNAQILPKTTNSTVPITRWVPHPIDLGVTAVGVDNGYAVQGSGTMIAMGGGYNVGNAQEVSKGHVFMWGDEWITYNSEWTLHPDYQVQLFWLNAIKWLTVQGKCQVPIPPSLGGPVVK